MQMDAGISKMALECYGYGRWDAPYWFIGPEQGMSQDEEVEKRVEAWFDLGGNDLSDCLVFHEKINEVRWHGLDGKQPRLQKTWKQLMLFLKAFLGTPMHLEKLEDKKSLCSYQRDHWGRLTGETCLIELCGLPAHTYKSGERQRQRLFEGKQYDAIRQKRIAVIREKMLAHRPKLVVMYGRKEKESWENIALVAREFPHGAQPPILRFPPHPVSHEGVKNAYWEELGRNAK